MIPGNYNYSINMINDVEAYVAQMLQDKQYLAPVRIVMAGNDS